MAKSCPLCRRNLGLPGGLIADKDDAGQHFTFAICLPCGIKYRKWSPAIKMQQIRAAIGLIAINPDRYELKLFDSKAAAWLYIDLEAAEIRKQRTFNPSHEGAKA